MSESDRLRWNRRYQEGSYRARTHATPFLQEWLPRLPRGRALDVACGTGRNTLYLACNGYQVDGVDISSSALDSARAKPGGDQSAVTWIEADLDEFIPQTSGYDLIVVARFVNRLLMPRLAVALNANGALLYEHHIKSDEPVDGPKDPDFRLAPGELRRWFQDLEIRFFEEGLSRDPDGRTMALARMVAFNSAT